MARTIENTARALVGLDNFHYAKLLLDTKDTIAYGEIVSVPDTIELNVNTNSSAATLFADNKPAIAYSTIGVVEVSMTKATLPNEFLADVLGSPMVGAVRHVSSAQSSPYVGIAWRQKYNDGNFAFVKLYKGMFTEPENNSKTSEEGVEFQTRAITANFISTKFEATADGGKKFNYIMATCDETDEAYTNEGDTWFDSMIAPIAAWVTAIAYVLGDLVLSGGNVYKCISAHTAAATFAADLTALKWELVGAY